MGLMIVKKLVHLSQGMVTVSSDGLNKGATFSFTMRMQKSDSNGHRDRLRMRALRQSENTSQSKLITEDPDSGATIMCHDPTALSREASTDTIRIEEMKSLKSLI